MKYTHRALMRSRPVKLAPENKQGAKKRTFSEDVVPRSSKDRAEDEITRRIDRNSVCFPIETSSHVYSNHFVQRFGSDI